MADPAPDAPRTKAGEPVSEPIEAEFPVHVWKVMVFLYAVLVGAAFLTFTIDVQSGFMAAAAVGLVVTVFSIGWVLLKTESHHRHYRRRTLADMFATGLKVGSGKLRGGDAMLQVLIIPLVLACGMIVLGILNVLERG